MIDEIVASAREDVEQRRRELPEQDLERLLRSGRSMAGVRSRHGLKAALQAPGLSAIAEFKRRSPSAGTIADHGLGDRVTAYTRGGARAISVLTDGPHFGGSLADLEAARRHTGLPILRKDFVVDRYQLLEALHCGADAVLLIVRVLDDRTLGDLLGEASRLGLDSLVEVHSAAELDRAMSHDAAVVGINNRDLDTGEVDVETCFELAARLPAGTVTVAESGLSDPEQLLRLQDAGLDGALIGESVMRAADAEAELRRLLSRI